jgi:predicted nucleic acid-binding protein
MAAVFLDTSALLRRYDATEPGSSRVRAVCDPAARHTLLLTQLTPVEVASALQRKRREAALTARDLQRIWRLFLAHRHSQYRRLVLTEACCLRAEALVGSYPLTAADALQLACALAGAEELGTQVRLQFWTADTQQAGAARREGLHVEFVN